MARILVIDDDETLRDRLSRLLTEAGHETACAENGEMGLRLLAASAFDLIVNRTPPSMMPEAMA